MMELGLSNFMMFFIVIGGGVAFIIAWIIRSESRIDTARTEITKLNTAIAQYEREKFALLEKIAALQNGKPVLPDSDNSIAAAESILSDTALRAKNEALSEENSSLKRELDEAKKSLEEVYKALSSQE